MTVNPNLVIGKSTCWRDLGLSKVQSKVLAEQLLNLPVSALASSAQTLAEILEQNNLAVDRYLDSLRNVWSLLVMAYLPLSPAATDCVYFHQTSPVAALPAGQSQRWQFHRSLQQLNTSKLIVFCDVDPEWNLSAALALLHNGVGQARVWPEGS